MDRLLHLLLPLALIAACGDGSGDAEGVRLYFDLDGATDSPRTFFDAPFPSDLRIHADGRPDLTGYPNPRETPVVAGLREIADQRLGFPVMPVVYFRFDGPLASASENDVIAADLESDIFLINVDAASAGLGELVPLVAKTLASEDWTPDYMLALAPRPGFVLRGNTGYAVVVKRSFGDAEGKLLGVPAALRSLARGEAPSGSRGAAALELYAPLWTALEAGGVSSNEVAAATVFRTGDQVVALAELSDAVMARDPVTIENIAIDPTDGADHARFCELHAEVEFAQYQVGTPPFDSGGAFEIGPDGLPIVQRTERAPLVLAIPKMPMPAAGYPLMLYFHGSGGVAQAVVDAGPASIKDGPTAAGLGPAHVVAEHGIASAGAALPLSPDRLANASYIAYLNFNNLKAFRDTFRQGVIEQRILLAALTELTIDPAVLAGCVGPSLPQGATAYSFDVAHVVASGQSMGGMYTNLITPIEPLIGAAVPTGAGGMWNKMILETSLLDNVADFVAIVVGTSADKNSFLHPGMHLLALAWEAAEPVAFMSRIARRPLAGRSPARPIYAPVGQDDGFFPTSVFDAAALSYGSQQAGDEVWPEMQGELVLDGLSGIASYPIADNITGGEATQTTGVVVQYAADPIERDGHYIYRQLDAVIYQYGCFFASFVATGTATVPAPAPLGTPCPGM